MNDESAGGGAQTPLSAPPPDPGESAADLRAPASRRLEVVVAATALVAAGVAIYLARTIEVRGGAATTLGPQWWPTVLGLLALGLAVMLLLTAALRPPPDRGETLSIGRGGIRRVAATIGLLVGYVILWQTPVGYAVTTVLFLVAAMWVSGARSWKALLVFPVATTAFIVVLFSSLLRVPL